MPKLPLISELLLSLLGKWSTSKALCQIPIQLATTDTFASFASCLVLTKVQSLNHKSTYNRVDE